VPRRDPRIRLRDILDAIERIQEYTADQTAQTFADDRMRVDAVVRNIEVIGEAANHVDAYIEARCHDVPWQDIRDMRHLLIHEYFGVSVAIVWETVVVIFQTSKRRHSRLLSPSRTRRGPNVRLVGCPAESPSNAL